MSSILKKQGRYNLLIDKNMKKKVFIPKSSFFSCISVFWLKMLAVYRSSMRAPLTWTLPWTGSSEMTKNRVNLPKDQWAG